MPLEEITGTRDLTFSRWHRSLPADCTWIDIDCCHYCHYCNSLLALFELVRCPDELVLVERCRRKSAAITERLGIKAEIPVYKIAYTGTPLQRAAVMQLGNPEVLIKQNDELARFIARIHDCKFCREHGGGRFRSTAIPGHTT